MGLFDTVLDVGLQGIDHLAGTELSANTQAKKNRESQERQNNANLASQNYWNEQNLANQKAMQEYEKGVQSTTWAREDNATQRRAADLEAAGLSKTLAAGSAAQTSSPINVTTPQGTPSQGVAPQRDIVDTTSSGLVNDAMLVMQLLKMNGDISYTNAQTRAVEAQARQTSENILFGVQSEQDRLAALKYANENAMSQNILNKSNVSKNDVEKKRIQAQTALSGLEYDIGSHNLQKSKDLQVRTSDPLKLETMLYGALDDTVGKLFGDGGIVNKGLNKAADAVNSIPTKLAGIGKKKKKK
ncbi:MAG: hypothetical protein Ta2B_10530 [Termitinemataceae bacterium]|nr:MAG: hypothetical protein Ta2B_10530 [Termitinemataceae bacterium]